MNRIKPEDLTVAMAAAADQEIRERLRRRIMEKIEPDITASIEAIMETFKTTVQAWKDLAHDETVFKFLIEDRRGGARHDDDRKKIST